jgi:hypothetical protein
MMAVAAATTLPAVALKLALLCPTAMVTAAGTERLALSLDSAMLKVEAAACVLVTVQTALALLVRVVVAQLRLLNWAAAAKVRMAVRFCPFSVAVTVAVPLVLIVDALAENVAVLDPTATVTLAGTVTVGLLLANAMAVATPATRSREAVQLDVWLLFNVAGVQERDTRTGATRLRLAVWLPPFSVAVNVTF